MKLYIYISFSLIINIIHLPFAHLPKYALFPAPLPPKRIFEQAVFFFSWDYCSTLEKTITKVMRNFGEQTRYIMVDVQMADGSIHMIFFAFKK